ncbi:MAG: DUF6483 family protein [Lachnospiraceae bacterium]
MVEQDYYMRIVKDLGRMISRLLFNKFEPEYIFQEDETMQEEMNYKEVLQMLEAGDINGAENLLYQYMEDGDDVYLEMALDFYDRVNEYDNDYLEDHDYSREEVSDGINHVLESYQVDVDLSALNSIKVD